MRRLTGPTSLIGASLRELARMTRASRVRPDPPRQLRYSGGVLSWLPPVETSNITHFRIYVGNEQQLVREVPLGQTQISQFAANASVVLVSSYNYTGSLESRRVPLSANLTLAQGGFVIATFNLVEEIIGATDVTPRIEVLIDTGQGAYVKPVSAVVNAKGVPVTTELILDVMYSTDPHTTPPASRTWVPLFPNLTAAEIAAGILASTHYKLRLPAGQERRQAPVTQFSNPSTLPHPQLPLQTMLRCDVLQASGASDVVAKVRFSVH